MKKFCEGKIVQITSSHPLDKQLLIIEWPEKSIIFHPFVRTLIGNTDQIASSSSKDSSWMLFLSIACDFHRKSEVLLSDKVVVLILLKSKLIRSGQERVNT